MTEDFPPLERLDGCGRLFQEIVRVIGREVPGRIDIQVGRDPSGEAAELFIRVVPVGNDIGDHLEVDTGLFRDDPVFEDIFQHRAAGEVLIEALCKAFDIQSIGVDMAKERLQCRRIDHTGRDHDRQETLFPGDFCRIENILEPDARLIVGPGNGTAVKLPGQCDELLGKEIIHPDTVLGGLAMGDFPVLTMLATLGQDAFGGGQTDIVTDAALALVSV